MNEWLLREWSKTREQLDANPRLRWGVLAIPLIGLLYLNLVVSDARYEEREALVELQQQLSEASQLAEQDEWVNRLDLVRARLDEQLARRFGKAESEAFARADIQASAQALLSAQSLEKIRIEVSTAGKPDPATNLIPLQLRLAGNAQGEQLYALIAGLESATPSYRIDNLSVQSQRGQHLIFSLVASVWYQPWEVGQ
ncbi:hypothetical protein EGJ86_00825 [Pseudomonas sp. o96-267]|uniref:GspMb/PilO family protein n=1 Tax=Pseudomonas sp. o96-267 TaxID=2479853 RepID=UPI000F7687F6|nr:GspMb/PilO family protein [Pseudomonas sp. o96-267]RRV43161.1 hypothetical protein EGJ86_00825 [Pseudomonas sp. o96-267]